uniref:Cilia-and flagella-associated protein 96 n=1 Tax=Schistosoma japonicum TaxID=6182 RepID=C1LE50_SCHJA|nr:Protein saal1 [Schistosoma japonicum]
MLADFDRLGIFKEMSYHTIGDPYDKKESRTIRSAFKGKQMYCDGFKEKSATPDGYFGPFIRIYNGDNKISLERLKRLQRKESAEKIRGKAWVPPNGPHHIHGSGSFLDTFSGPIPYFKPLTVVRKQRVSSRINIYTSPSKKGCGSYVDITIGKYPSYKSDPYNKKLKSSNKEGSSSGKQFYLNMHPQQYFDKNPYHRVSMRRRPFSKTHNKPFYSKLVFKPSSAPKLIGGCKDGCFSPFPHYSSDRPRKTVLIKSSKPALKIPSCSKTYPISSVLELNIKRRINSSNYKNVKTSLFDS